MAQTRYINHRGFGDRNQIFLKILYSAAAETSRRFVDNPSRGRGGWQSPQHRKCSQFQPDRIGVQGHDGRYFFTQIYRTAEVVTPSIRPHSARYKFLLLGKRSDAQSGSLCGSFPFRVFSA